MKYLIIILLFFSGSISFAQEELPAPPWTYFNHLGQWYAPKEPEISADAFLLLDMNSGNILAARNEHTLIIMASLVKMMTAYIILQEIQEGDISWNDRYLIEDVNMFTHLPNDASLMGLKYGDSLSITDLMKGLLVVSGNDAAVMLALITYGSIEYFVRAMNVQAKLLGLNNTQFFDTTGLSPKNVSTAQDIALLSYYLLRYPQYDITQITKLTSLKYSYEKRSTNLLLNTYKGIDGLKTGFIEESGFNFVATAQRNFEITRNRRLLVILLGVPGSTIAEGVVARAKMAEQLLDYGFNAFTRLTIGYKTQDIRIWGGKTDSISIHAQPKIVLLPTLWINNLQVNLEINPYIWAPISVEDTLAIARINLETENNTIQSGLEGMHIKITDIMLTSDTSIKQAGFISRMIDYIIVFFLKMRDLKNV